MAKVKRPPPTPTETNAWVGKESAVYRRMAERTKLIDALMGGTEGMQKAGEVYLPKEPGEERPAYDTRLRRSTCHGFLRSTVRRLSARPFGKPVTIRIGRDLGTLPELLAPIESDADYSDSSLTQFGRRLMADALQRGLVHFLVDMPGDVRELSTKDEREGRVHPYFVHVSAKDLIGWKAQRGKGNRLELTQIRIRECHVVEVDGEETEVEHVRVWDAPSEAAEGVDAVPGTWQLYRKNKDADGYALVESGPHTFPGIPLVTVYFNRTGFMEAEPPLADLAELERAHWASRSDQTNILRYARVPKMAMAGVSDEESRKPSLLGVQAVWKLKDPNSKAWWVEIQGNAVSAGRQDILDLQAEMNVRALQPLMERTGDETATGQEISDKNTTSDLKAWVRAIEAGFLQGFGFAALFARTKLPEKFGVDVFDDWAPPSLTLDQVRLLKEIRQAGELSRTTFLSLLKGLILPEDLDVAKEADAIEDEGPSLAEFGAPSMEVDVETGEPTEPAAAEAGAAAEEGGQVKPRVPATGNLADTALTGAQVQSALSIVQEVGAGKLPRDSGVSMLVGFFNLDPTEAEAIMGSVGKGFTPKADQAPAEPTPGDDDERPV